MLLNLHVKNLAIIEETEVDFTEGLNILSGETGAGKSIIIDSVNLALGEKVPKEIVRDEEQGALVELIFQVTEESQIRQLEQLDIVPEDGLIIISRKMMHGRSLAKINSETVSVAKLKEVAAILIDIHGQHEHQSLLHKRKHLEILDDYAKADLNGPKAELQKAYKEYTKLREEWNKQNIDKEQQKRELSFLEFEYNEITQADLKIGEDETLEEEFKRFLHGKKIMEALTNGYQQTSESGAADLVDHALRELQSVSAYDRQVEQLCEQLREIDSLLSDFNREVAGYMSEADFDEQTFQETEQRLNLVNHLKSKYGDTIEKILASAKEKEEKIEKLQNYDAYMEDLRVRLERAEALVQEKAKVVSEIRKRYAKDLVIDVKEALVDLNFLDVQFEMQFTETKNISALGMDDAEFMISTNPGEIVRPLGRVASGGELSRIMLAIKSVLAQNDKIDTLIFDEIDTGISGRTAQAVSEKMNVIGRNHQVICITHLPQIAAMADSHYLIEKVVEDGNTTSKITLLSEEDSVKELARMLGGVKITDIVLQSAKEMKELAYSKKQ